MIDYKKLETLFDKCNSFILTTHVNPDADAIGSQIALYIVLKRLGKDVSIINHSVIPASLLFLDENNVIEKYDSEKHNLKIMQADAVVLLDLNWLNRVVSMEEIIRKFKGEIICIDHHQNPEEFTENMFLDENASATGEIIHSFIVQTNLVKIDYKIALPLYAAIMTDTGSFRFEKTTSKTHNIVAEYLDLGVVPNWVYEQIYETGDKRYLKLLSKALDSLTVNSSEEISYMIIKQKDLQQTGTDESEVDGFIKYTLSFKNIKIGLLFFELENGLKISFRSKGKIPVNKLAAEFGGGGHLNAAGTRLFNCRLEEYLPKVLKRAEQYLKYQ